jgi:hypothetical protein
LPLLGALGRPICQVSIFCHFQFYLPFRFSFQLFLTFFTIYILFGSPCLFFCFIRFFFHVFWKLYITTYVPSYKSFLANYFSLLKWLILCKRRLYILICLHINMFSINSNLPVYWKAKILICCLIGIGSVFQKQYEINEMLIITSNIAVYFLYGK